MSDQQVANQVETKAPDVTETITALQARFPDAVKPDARKGYSGIVISNDKLVEVAHAIRDDFGFDYLSSATAVDYLGNGDHMEMVYHAFSITHGALNGPTVSGDGGWQISSRDENLKQPRMKI